MQRIPSILNEPEARPQPETKTPYSSGDRFCDLTGSGPQYGRAGAEQIEPVEERHVINGSYLEVAALGS